MNLDYLKTFCEVAKSGSLSEAARQLTMSQPAVSFHIRKLEQDLGVTLLDRGQKGITVTAAGKRVLLFAGIIEQKHDQLLDELDLIREEVAGELVISASTIPGNYILPPLLSEFTHRNPAVSTRMIVSDSGLVIRNIEEGTYAVGFSGIAPESHHLQSFEIAQDKIELIVFPEHAFARRQQVSLAELAEEQLIFREPSSGTRRSSESMLRQAGFDLSRRKPALVLGTNEAVVSAVEARAGIAFVSNYAAHKSRSLKLVEVVNVEGVELTRSFYCIYRQERLDSRLQLEFVDFMKQTV